jgi:hypothetical protein
MSEDQSTDPSADEKIVAAPPGANPGTADGVGEHVLQGMGHDGVQRMEGEFADLDDETASSTLAGASADPDDEASTRED